ncbi:unnamed protein product [Symbiodinium sp. CCMP2592]|nr:unnamed protein product [Symbiodinium sp. CCMP2592]
MERALTRRAVWVHDSFAVHRPQTSSRTADFAHQVAFAKFCEDMQTQQEPLAEQLARQAWARHDIDHPDAASLTPSESGDIGEERDPHTVFAGLSDERKEALAAGSSWEAPTRIVHRAPSEPPATDSEGHGDWLRGLSGRLDDVESFCGSIIDPRFSRSLHARLLRVERLLNVPEQ